MAACEAEPNSKDGLSSAFQAHTARNRYIYATLFVSHITNMLHNNTADTRFTRGDNSWAIKSGTDGCLKNLDQLSILVRLCARAKQCK